MTDGNPSSEGLLTLRGVSKIYPTQAGGASRALDEVNLSVARSEFLSLVGPSGCGKTTLMKIAAGLLRETTGQVLFGGRPGKPPRDKMGIVFQTAALLPWLTVIDNVIFPAVIQRKPKKDAYIKARELLELLGLKEKADRYPSELSGGMQQRVSIARALLLEPEVLFMDEPFGALDAMTRESLNVELQNIHSRYEMTVVFVTHSIAEAMFLSDRIAVMSPGPGRIVDVIDVHYDRPRTLETLTDEQFRVTEAHIRGIFSEKGKIHASKAAAVAEPVGLAADGRKDTRT